MGFSQSNHSKIYRILVILRSGCAFLYRSCQNYFVSTMKTYYLCPPRKVHLYFVLPRTRLSNVTATSSIFIYLLILVMIKSPTSFLNSFSRQQVSVGMHDDSCRLRPNTDLSLYTVQHLIAPTLFDKMMCSSASSKARMIDFRQRI